MTFTLVLVPGEHDAMFAGSIEVLDPLEFCEPELGIETAGAPVRGVHRQPHGPYAELAQMPKQFTEEVPAQTAPLKPRPHPEAHHPGGFRLVHHADELAAGRDLSVDETEEERSRPRHHAQVVAAQPGLAESLTVVLGEQSERLLIGRGPPLDGQSRVDLIPANRIGHARRVGSAPVVRVARPGGRAGRTLWIRPSFAGFSDFRRRLLPICSGPAKEALGGR